MTDRQLAIFLDADWVELLADTALGQLRDLTRNDLVQTYYRSAQSPVLDWSLRRLSRRDAISTHDPILQLALQAYLWLCERYRDGTALYLFGYGAGGIAALRLARLIAIAGLLRLPDERLIEKVLEWDTQQILAYPPDILAFRKEHSRTVRIRFVGLLDASGPFNFERDFYLQDRRDPSFDFLRANRKWIADGRLNPIVSHAFNALALDETFPLHSPILWTQTRRTWLAQQVWFRGSHSDLGRAFSVKNNPLGLFPFERMTSEAARRGLALRPRWRHEIRRAQRSVTRWVRGERDSGAQRLFESYGERFQLRSGRFRRRAGLVFGEEFDTSVSTPEIRRDVGTPLAGIQTEPPAEPPRSPLSEEDQTLFQVNEIKPPGEWNEDRRRDPYLEIVPGSDDLPSFMIAAERLPEAIPPRFLLAQFWQRRDGYDAQLVPCLEPDRPTGLRIAIGPADPDWLSAVDGEAFPYEASSRGKGDELTVVLSGWEGLSEPKIRHIVLPKRGRSTAAEFTLEPLQRGSNFSARVTVFHRNRVLQSAVLLAPVGTSVKTTLIVDAGILEDLSNLRRRTPADISLVINQRPAGQGRALFVQGEVAREIAVDASDPTVLGILDELEELARDPEANVRQPEHAKKVVLLRNLAVRGHSIYQVIRDTLTVGSQRLQPPPWPFNIQIVAAHSAKIYPLEFVYDYPPPGATNSAVQLCPYWKRDAALVQGTPQGCYPRCKLQLHGNHVCPNGFWGVKKIIERHAFHSGTADRALLSLGGTTRKTLSLHGAAVLGVSQIVHRADSAAAAAILSSLQESLRCDPAEPIKNWDHLKDLVSAHGPPLIVLLPHVQNTGPQAGAAPAAAGVYLEIENVLQRASEITPDHLMRGERAPLVLFLGCKGAISYSKYDNGLDHFRRAGAAAVIAPAARVAPANVVKFVRDLAQALQKSLGGKSALIGQALRDARRLQFTQGNFPALSIMGFGDGDLRITLKE